VARIIRTGDVELHGKVVAELTFGFWSRLLARHYESSLWTHALRHAFPLGLSRGVVYDRFDKLHKLRNRVAHYEPVLSMHHLTNWYRILEKLDWLNSDYRAMVEDLCTLPEVASRQP